MWCDMPIGAPVKEKVLRDNIGIPGSFGLLAAHLMLGFRHVAAMNHTMRQFDSASASSTLAALKCDREMCVALSIYHPDSRVTGG
jgi:hypothetical protein